MFVVLRIRCNFVTTNTETELFKLQKIKIMKKWTQIEEINAGDIVFRSNGIAKPSEIEVLSIQVNGSYARMTWKWKNSNNSYYSTNFRKLDNLADYGFWYDLTSQQWELKN